MSQFKRIPLSQFNTTFKRLLDQAQILEGTSRPKDSLPKYFELVELIVGFVKTPDCPSHLKSKLINTSKTLIDKIKTIQNSISVQNPPTIQTTNLNVTTSSPAEIDETAFAALPDIPSHSPDDDLAEPPPVKNDSGSTSSPFPVIDKSTPPSKTPDSSAKPSGENKNGVMDDFISKIQNFEEELRKMPPGVTEVKPNDFNPYNVLTPTDPNASNINLDAYKKDTIILDKTVMDINKTSRNDGIPQDLVKRNIPDPGFKIKGFKKDPFKADSDLKDASNEKPKDPFANPDISDLGSNKSDVRVCFACGAQLNPGSQVCSNCGAMNE